MMLFFTLSLLLLLLPRNSVENLSSSMQPTQYPGTRAAPRAPPPSPLERVSRCIINVWFMIFPMRLEAAEGRNMPYFPVFPPLPHMRRWPNMPAGPHCAVTPFISLSSQWILENIQECKPHLDRSLCSGQRLLRGPGKTAEHTSFRIRWSGLITLFKYILASRTGATYSMSLRLHFFMEVKWGLSPRVLQTLNEITREAFSNMLQ